MTVKLDTLTKLNTELQELTSSLKSGKRLYFEEDNWKFRDELPTFLDRVLDRDNSELIKLPAIFIKKIFRELEKHSVLFSCSSANNIKARNLQNEVFANIINASKTVKKAIIRAPIPNKDALLMNLEMETVSIKYRYEKENQGLDPVAIKDIKYIVQESLFKNQAQWLPMELPAFKDGMSDAEKDQITLYKEAIHWKAAESRFPLNDRFLSERDKQHLKEICRYPSVLELFSKYPPLRESYYQLAFRDNFEEKSFVEYFHIVQETLYHNLMLPRIATLGSDMLKVEKRTSKKMHDVVKELTLPFELQKADKSIPKNGIPLPSNPGCYVKYKSILDKAKVLRMDKGYEQTIQDVFDTHADKNNNVGHLEFGVRDGQRCVMNWNCCLLGPYNPTTGKVETIDLKKDEWWKALPESTIPLTKAEMQQRYNQLSDLKDGEWVLLIHGTRKTPDLSIVGCHGFPEVAIPDKDGKYHIYSFGKLAAVYPGGYKGWGIISEILNTMALLFFLADTVEARVYCPDENIFYCFRQHAVWLMKLAGIDDQKKLMDLLRDFLIRGLEGNMVFQFGWENCAFFPDDLIRKLFEAKPEIKLPNFFKVSIFDLNLPQPFKIMFDIISFFPEAIQTFLTNIVELIVLAWRGLEIEENGKRIWKSISNSPFSTELKNILPAFLPQQVCEGTIPGTVWYGAR
jgi:hypothetical protein